MKMVSDGLVLHNKAYLRGGINPLQKYWLCQLEPKIRRLYVIISRFFQIPGIGWILLLS